jgi:hypothetical protein
MVAAATMLMQTRPTGGEYDWIGRAAGDEFVGFFTSSKYAGEFRLQRQKE